MVLVILYYNGIVVETVRRREIHLDLKNLCRFNTPVGVDPYLQKKKKHRRRMRYLSGYAVKVRFGYFGRGRQVQSESVYQALTAVGTTISLAYGNTTL